MKKTKLSSRKNKGLDKNSLVLFFFKLQKLSCLSFPFLSFPCHQVLGVCSNCSGCNKNHVQHFSTVEQASRWGVLQLVGHVPSLFICEGFDGKEGCHNDFSLYLDDHKNKWSRHRSFLYECDRSPGMYVLK